MVVKKQMQLNKPGPIFFLLLHMAVLSSCDLFLGLPRLRENAAESASPISKLSAVAPDTSSAEFHFLWKEAEEWADEEMILKEVVLVWSDTAFPTSPHPTFINENQSVSYDAAGVHEKTLTGLAPGEIVYAALYGRTGSGWHLPRYAKVVIPEAAPIASAPLVSVPEEWEIRYGDISEGDSYGQVNPPTTDPAPIPLSSSGFTSRLLDFSHDLQGIPDDGWIIQAQLELSFGTDPLDSGETIRVVPVVKDWHLDAQRLYTEHCLLENEGVSYTATAPTAPWSADITQVAQAARLSGTDDILIEMASGTVEISSVSLQITYLQP